MKKYLCGIAAGLLLAGCASSERMMRTSGGVLQSYSAPQKERLASGKFAAAVEKQNKAHRAGLQDLGGIHAVLVNLWPGYFRNQDYISCLWPMIDYDPYGFAVRPFYNQEGDDYSVLFPLSAWNPARDHGWALNVYWNKKAWGVFPLVHCSPDCAWYTPLWLVSGKENRQYDPFRDPYETKSLHLIGLLGYGGKETRRADRSRAGLHSKLRQPEPSPTLAYCLAPYGIQTPLPRREDTAGWDAIRRKVAAQLPEESETWGGLFPLFHFNCNGNEASFRVLGWLPRYKHTPALTECGFLGCILGKYVHEKRYYAHYARNGIRTRASQRDFLSLMLMSGFKTIDEYTDSPQLRALQKLYTLDPVKDRAAIRRELAVVNAKFKLPESVQDNRAFHAFLQDVQEGTPFPAQSYTDGGFLPLYLQFSSRDYGSRISPALLSWYYWNKQDSTFFSLPLLSLISRREQEATDAVFWPAGYYRNRTTNPQNDCGIFAPSADPRYGCLATENMYLFCGLLHRSEKTFYTARPGFDAGALEQLRLDVQNICHRQKQLRRRLENVQLRRKKVWPQKTKIEYYQYMIEQEHIREEETAIGKEQQKLDRLAGEIARKAADAHIPDFDPRKTEEAFRKLYRNCNELTRKEYGHRILFSRTEESTGKYAWDVCLALASGNGDRENEDMQILQFLYRYKRRGTKSETVFFPFVSIQKDGADSRFRFLWRVFERTVEKGKASGYILFFPY